MLISLFEISWYHLSFLIQPSPSLRSCDSHDSRIFLHFSFFFSYHCILNTWNRSWNIVSEHLLNDCINFFRIVTQVL